MATTRQKEHTFSAKISLVVCSLVLFLLLKFFIKTYKNENLTIASLVTIKNLVRLSNKIK